MPNHTSLHRCFRVYIVSVFLTVGVACSGPTEEGPSTFNAKLDSAPEVIQDSATPKEVEAPGPEEQTNPRYPPITEWECMPTPFRHSLDGFENRQKEFGVFDSLVLVYDHPIPDSGQVLDTLFRGSPVNPLAENNTTFLVCTPKGKAGYVRRESLYFESHRVHNNERYVVGMGQYAKLNEPWSYPSILRVARFNESHEVVSQYVDSTFSGSPKVRIYPMEYLALKDVRTTLQFTSSYYSGEGVILENYMVDVGEIVPLIEVGASGDGSSYTIGILYLPIYKDGEVLLAKNGSPNQDTDEIGKPFYPYPEDCGIPIEELVVVIYEERVGNLDAEPDEYYRNYVYYSWDGHHLTERKKGKLDSF